MSLRVRKTLVFVSVIILLLSFQFFGSLLTEQNDDQISAKENGKYLQTTHREVKSQLIGDPVVKIESKKQTSPKSMLPSLAPGDPIFACDNSDIAIIDAEVYSDIIISGYPTNWIVTFVDVRYDIIHTARGDLTVDLRVVDGIDTISFRLFTGIEGDTTNDVHGSETFIMNFWGKEVNQEWLLWVNDRVDSNYGYIDYWDITIRYNYRLEGEVTYQNVEDNDYYPLRKVKVVLHEDSPSGPVLDSTFTDDDGKYMMEYEPIDGYIYPVVVFYFDPIADIRDYDDISAGPITADYFEDLAGALQINPLIWKDISLPAAHIWDYIMTERAWMREHTYDDTTGRRFLMKCYVDYNELIDQTRYVFSRSVTDSIIFTNRTNQDDSKAWYRKTVFHEYAHAIFVDTYEFAVKLDTVIHGHAANTVSMPGFAFFEGWAEFIQCIIPDDDSMGIAQYGGNIETNEWWKGPDDENEDGSIVEGAVASALYDMQDNHWDSDDEWNTKDDTSANLYGMFPDIFKIIQERRPANIEGFMQAWKDSIDDIYLKNSAVGIVRSHGINVSYIADEKFVPVPKDFTLLQNYPNPFNSQTAIEYHIPSEGMVNLTIYNILGQKVKTCVNEKKIPGYYTYFWEGKNDKDMEAASGVYICRMSFQDKKVSKLMVLLK